MVKGISGLGNIGNLVGGFIAIEIASQMLALSAGSLKDAGILKNDNSFYPEGCDEYENLSSLETEEIDLDKKLDIKRTINDDGELI